MPETVSYRERHLPHWMVDDRPYFVTMRLKGSLPKEVVLRLKGEYAALQRSGANKAQLLDCRRRHFAKLDAILDAANDDQCYLRNPEVAQEVLDSFEWLQRERGWTVFALTIMPNHVHLLLQNMDGRNGQLSQDLGDVKSYTAKRANKLLHRTGHFWQDENFDHWIRNEEKFHASIRYIKNNPVMAGLVANWYDWPWTRICQ